MVFFADKFTVRAGYIGFSGIPLELFLHSFGEIFLLFRKSSERCSSLIIFCVFIFFTRLESERISFRRRALAPAGFVEWWCHRLCRCSVRGVCRKQPDISADRSSRATTRVLLRTFRVPVHLLAARAIRRSGFLPGVLFVRLSQCFSCSSQTIASSTKMKTSPISRCECYRGIF